MQLLLDEDLLRVRCLQPGGLIGQWNTEHPDQQVRNGDWFVSVNGVQGSGSGMFTRLQRDAVLNITVSREAPPTRSDTGNTEDEASPSQASSPPRVRRFLMTLKKDDERMLGLQVSVTCRRVTVVRILPGIFQEWNDRNPERKLCVGDIIVFVNGVAKEEMLSELARPGILHILVQQGAARRGKHGALALTDSALAALPRTTYRGRSGEQECGICLQDWECGDEAMQLPCKHTFHPDCAAMWLLAHSALCPLCGWAAHIGKGITLDLDNPWDVPPTEEEDEPKPCARSPPFLVTVLPAMSERLPLSKPPPPRGPIASVFAVLSGDLKLCGAV